MWLVVVTSGLALTICCAAFVVNSMIRIRSSKVSQLTALAEVLASDSTVAVSFEEADSARALLEALAAIKTVEYAQLQLADESILAEYDRNQRAAEMNFDWPTVDRFNFTDDGHLDIGVPILEEGETLGWLFIRSNMNDLHAQVQKSIVIAAVVLAGSFLAAIILSLCLHRRISGPVRKLADLAQRISNEGDYSLRIDHKSPDEIGSLCRLFNEMLERVEESENHLRDARDQLEERVAQRTQELSDANDQLKHEMEERERMNRNIIDLSHRAGKAEIATGVLHNVGNVLNSINVSAGIVDETLRNTKATSLQKAAALLNEQHCLAEFFTLDERGEKFPVYLTNLAKKLIQERDRASDELQSLIENLDHVKTIVSMQQSYAGVSGVQEVTKLPELVNDAEMLNASSMAKHGVTVVRDYDDLPELLIEKQKLLQVLVNLLRNAKDAMTEGQKADRTLRIGIKKAEDLESGEQRVQIVMQDNGVGISEENLTKIFSHGFTTKKDGHGFGLHTCANACKEMGGSLCVESDGPGEGAKFTIDLPYREASVPV